MSDESHSRAISRIVILPEALFEVNSLTSWMCFSQLNNLCYQIKCISLLFFLDQFCFYMNLACI